MRCLVSVEQVGPVETFVATGALVWSSILVTLQMPIEMVCSLIGSTTDVTPPIDY
jgi:hypothetical protein